MILETEEKILPYGFIKSPCKYLPTLTSSKIYLDYNSGPTAAIDSMSEISMVAYLIYPL